MRRQVAVFCAVLVALTGCSGPVEPTPTGDASQSASTASPTGGALPDGTVSTEVLYLGATVTLAVHPIEVRDGVALLTVDYSLPDGPPLDSPLALGLVLKDATGWLGPEAVRLVDFDAGRVHVPGTDSDKKRVVTRDGLVLEPGATLSTQSFYAAPASSSVGVMFPFFGMVLDVPVVSLKQAFEVTPADLGREGEITYSSFAMDTFTVAYDDSSSARVEGTAASVALSSDVLFAVDEAVLTPAVQQAVAGAAEQIKSVADGGEIAVVGHTDDVASDAYNQDLSVRRAQAVAAVLTATVGSGFTVVPSGRGESEPVAEGTSAEARAANRRVAIAFTASQAGAAVDVGTGAGAPAPVGPTGTGTASVEVPFKDGTFGVRAVSVVRHGAYLVGTLEAERSSSGTAILAEFFGTPVQSLHNDRKLGMTTSEGGAHSATLLGTGSRFYPLDYVIGTSSSVRRGIVADQFLNATMDQNDSTRVTVMWPDPGGDSVTIDVPERFRLTDVPVTDG